jgi:hypothetical protein
MKRLLVKVVRFARKAAVVVSGLMVPTHAELVGSTYSAYFGFFWPGLS